MSWRDEARAYGFGEHQVDALERIERAGGVILRVTREAIALRTPDRTGRGVTAAGEPWRTESPGAVQTVCRVVSAAGCAAARALGQEEAA